MQKNKAFEHFTGYSSWLYCKNTVQCTGSTFLYMHKHTPFPSAILTKYTQQCNASMEAPSWARNMGAAYYVLKVSVLLLRIQKSKQKEAKVFCYLWTMSETDDKKLSILLENISAPFLKKLIWKIQIRDTGSHPGFGRQKTDCLNWVNSDPITIDALGWQTNTWLKQLCWLLVFFFFAPSHPFMYPFTHTSYWLLTGTFPMNCWMTTIRGNG